MNKISIFRVILKNVLVFQNRFGKNDHTVVLIIIYVTDGFDTVFHEKTFCPVKIFNHIALIFKKDRYKNFIFKNKENIKESIIVRAIFNRCGPSLPYLCLLRPN